jgi:hypothetical protein
MDETRWLTSAYPQPLLAYLRRPGRVARKKAGRRKLRLFACACCRRLWPTLRPEQRLVVEQTERAADGLTTLAVVQQAWAAAHPINLGAGARTVLSFILGLFGGRPIQPEPVAVPESTRLELVRTILWHLSRTETWAAVSVWRPAGGREFTPVRGTEPKAERKFQADLVRCLFGNPFHPANILPAWRTTAAVGLARGIYDEPAFDRLPILADALEDAGCDEAAVLNHCRHERVHARGCWVVDALLGR